MRLEHVAEILGDVQHKQLADLDQRDGVSEVIWRAIETAGIVENQNTVVAGTKCLHHLLPDLIPPMDRAFTQVFFGWHNPDFQHHPEECFRYAFSAFGRIAASVNVARYVGRGWRTSVPKLIDNALVAFCRMNRLVRASSSPPPVEPTEWELLSRARALGIYEEILDYIRQRVGESEPL